MNETITPNEAPDQAPVPSSSAPKPPPVRTFATCSIATLLLFAIIDWICFRGGMHLLYIIGSHVTDFLGAGCTRIGDFLNSGFEAWGRAGRNHTEATVWIIGVPTVLGLCHAVRAQSGKGFGVFFIGLLATYFTPWVSLSDPGDATAGFGKGILGLFAVIVIGFMFVVVNAASDPSDNGQQGA